MFGKTRLPVAIDIGSHAVKLVQLEQTKKGLTLARLGMASLAPDAVVDGGVRDHEEVMRAVEELISAERTKAKEVVVALSGSAAVVRTLLLPEMRGLALEEAVEAEAAQILPFPIEEVRLSRTRLGRVEVDGQPMEEHLLVAVRRKALSDIIELFKTLKLEPKIVDVNFLALESAYELAGGREGEEGPPGAVALVDIGASGTLVHVLGRSRTLLTRSIPLGGASVTNSLAGLFGVGRTEAESIKLGVQNPPSPRAAADAVRAEVERLARELGRTLQLLWQTFPEERVSRMILSGGGAHLEGLPAYLGASLDLIVEMAQPFRLVTIPADSFDPEYVELLGPIAAVGAGLAYRAVEAA